MNTTINIFKIGDVSFVTFFGTTCIQAARIQNICIVTDGTLARKIVARLFDNDSDAADYYEWAEPEQVEAIRKFICDEE